MPPLPEIRITDTLTGRKQLVEPNGDGVIGIYACGPTVYSRIHVGNARPFVVFTLLARFLEHVGYRTKLVMNVTDINDKIYAAARDTGRGSADHAAEMTRLYVEDTDALGLGRPDAEPLASETIAEIVSLIEALVASGHAYESGGDVYFRVRSFPAYGELSNRDPDDMNQGEEAGTASLKESPLDFALWKATKPDEDTAWDSPWGPGRPGWHIECSAMAEKHLGIPFAIHGGGTDLVFPHHENEIAQTVAGRERPLARIWMHNGMVRTGPEAKMAKSVGNVFALHEAIAQYGREAVIDFLISGHYRQPIAFSAEALDQSLARTARIRDFFRSVERLDREPAPAVSAARERFLGALAEDFNTPEAMAAIFGLLGEAHREPLAGAHAAIAEMLGIVGLESLAAEDTVEDPEAERLLAEREAARAQGDFARADRLREEIHEWGLEVRDTPQGARLVRR